MYFDLARVLITSTPLWLLNLRATSRANHHKTEWKLLDKDKQKAVHKANDSIQSALGELKD